MRPATRAVGHTERCRRANPLSMLAADPGAVDVVIPDVRMPIPQGIDVLAMARSAGVTTPFVLITAFSSAKLRDAASRMHATVLDKPFLAAELEARIRDLMPPSDAPVQPVTNEMFRTG